MDRFPSARERSDELERASLSTWATLAAESKGRDAYEEADPLRTTFQSDRDRILGTRAFRRLAGKTHTVIGASVVEQRSRLAHALDASRSARTIARGLRLNEDLAEAVALGQGLGHPPFGRAGVAALDGFEGRRFVAGEQSVRVVERLERGGLNLSWEVRDGILHAAEESAAPSTPEGQVARLAARISDVTAGLDEAEEAGVITPDDIDARVRTALGPTHRRRQETLVADVVAMSADRVEIRMSEAAEEGVETLATLLAQRVEGRPDAVTYHERAVHCLRSLAVYFLERPEDLLSGPDEEPDVVRVLDVLAAMTDGGALATFTEQLLPRVPRA